MKYQIFFWFIIFCLISFGSVSAINPGDPNSVYVNYGEMYACDNSYVFSIMEEPQLKANVSDKIPYTLLKLNPATGELEPTGIEIEYGTAGRNEKMYEVRLHLKNLNQETLLGLKPESFTLLGYVRGVEYAYTPEVIMPVDVDDNYYLDRLNRNEISPAVHIPKLIEPVSVHQFTDNYYEDEGMHPLREWDLHLIYRVPPFLRNWAMRIDLQPVQGLSADMTVAYYASPSFSPCTADVIFPSTRDESLTKTYYYKYE